MDNGTKGVNQPHLPLNIPVGRKHLPYGISGLAVMAFAAFGVAVMFGSMVYSYKLDVYMGIGIGFICAMFLGIVVFVINYFPVKRASAECLITREGIFYARKPGCVRIRWRDCAAVKFTKDSIIFRGRRNGEISTTPEFILENIDAIHNLWRKTVCGSGSRTFQCYSPVWKDLASFWFTAFPLIIGLNSLLPRCVPHGHSFFIVTFWFSFMPIFFVLLVVFTAIRFRRTISISSRGLLVRKRWSSSEIPWTDVLCVHVYQYLMREGNGFRYPINDGLVLAIRCNRGSKFTWYTRGRIADFVLRLVKKYCNRAVCLDEQRGQLCLLGEGRWDTGKVARQVRSIVHFGRLTGLLQALVAAANLALGGYWAFLVEFGERRNGIDKLWSIILIAFGLSAAYLSVRAFIRAARNKRLFSEAIASHPS